jgi:BirA family biotin operon repressor/biotin-[acetyl-CoA-carboxylase] ligase
VNAPELRVACRAHGLPEPVVLAEVGSTNDEARRLAERGAPHGTLVIAHVQTSGRGRLGRTWISSPGDALTMSVILRPDLPVHALPRVVLAAGVALAETCGAGCRLKWPNDLVSDEGKKLGGVLAEVETRSGQVQFVVLGIGVNLLAAPDGMQATHLSAVQGVAPQLPVLAAAVARRLVDLVDDEEMSQIVARWSARDRTVGHRVRVGDIEGIAIGLDGNGCLLVRDDEGIERRITAGDVHMVGVPPERVTR